MLNDALANLPPVHRKDLVTPTGDDAAVVQIGDVQQVISTDHLRTVVHDPYLMTQIALQHALGDIWAMAAEPQIGLAQITLPRATPDIHAAMLAEITHAAQSALAEIGADLAGGHTSIGAELTIGFTLTGLAGSRAVGLQGAQPGDQLVLTRPIGTGVLLAAEMQGRAKGVHIAQLWRELARSQKEVARILASQARAMTDVTGFGLAGHLSRLCTASGTGADIHLDEVPVWPGAVEAVERGIASSLYRQNRDAVPELAEDSPMASLLFDPQTAGGLLAAVPAGRVISGAYAIGTITDREQLRLVT